MQMKEGDTLLTRKQIIEELRALGLAISAAAIYRNIKAGNFPKPDVRLSDQNQRWRRSTIEKFKREKGLVEA